MSSAEKRDVKRTLCEVLWVLDDIVASTWSISYPKSKLD